MLKSIGRGMASIGLGMANIMNAWATPSRFDDYHHLMPRGAAPRILTQEEAMRADAKSLRIDYRSLGQWKDIGNWHDMGNHISTKGKTCNGLTSKRNR
ncbi:hypothetical protein RYA05_02650 [Pseudomonas syringae pv. actinidiae]|nr:hypothetical protein [Pseudomonas syringae pv. actinidiae]